MPWIVKTALVGTSGGDDGVRGFLAAYDPYPASWHGVCNDSGPGEFGSSLAWR